MRWGDVGEIKIDLGAPEEIMRQCNGGDVGDIKIDLGAPEEIMRRCDGGDD